MTTDLAPVGLPTVRAPVAGLTPNPANPRTITKQRYADLVYSMTHDPEMLEVRPLIADLGGVVFAGNMRLRVAQELGWETIPTAFVDLSEERKAYWTLRDNQGYGDWDEAMLAEQMFHMNAAEWDMRLTGFSEDDLARVLASTGVGGEEHDEKGSALDPAAVTIGEPEHKVKRGEVWDVGPHVLACTTLHTGHALWVPLIAEKGADSIFVPYPSPAITLAELSRAPTSTDKSRAPKAASGDYVLVLVQPDQWISGHLCDAHERQFPGSVKKR